MNFSRKILILLTAVGTSAATLATVRAQSADPAAPTNDSGVGSPTSQPGNDAPKEGRNPSNTDKGAASADATNTATTTKMVPRAKKMHHTTRHHRSHVTHKHARTTNPSPTPSANSGGTNGKNGQ